MARCRGAGRKPSFIFAVFMILAGVILFLSNLGLIPVRNVWDYWPLVFVALGLSKIGTSRQFSGTIMGALLIFFGLLFTLVNIGVIPIRARDDSWPLSLVFIAIGLGGLAKVLEGGTAKWRRTPLDSGSAPPSERASTPPWPTTENWAGWSRNPETVDSPVLSNLALMASIRRKVDSPNFQGGTLIAFWGNIELDLRRCRPAEGRAAMFVDANAIMGSIKLRVPETWRVEFNGLNIMANFEDKTVPPVTVAPTPVLVLTGYSIMGQIEVES